MFSGSSAEGGRLVSLREVIADLVDCPDAVAETS